MIFLSLETMVTLPLTLTVRRPGCSLAQPSDQWYGGLGVSLNNSEGWKPQNLWVCWWTKCLYIWYLIHVAQDTARSWFSGRLTQIAHILGHLWVVSRTHGRVRVPQEALSHRALKAHIQRTNSFPPVARLKWGSEPFWGNKSYFGAYNVQFWKSTSPIGVPGPGHHRWVPSSKLTFGKATTLALRWLQ